MNFDWVPEALKQLNQYPNDRFWGMLIIITFIVSLCTWLLSKNT